MKIHYESSFDTIGSDEKSAVFQIIPDCFSDERGYFMEVVKDYGEWPYKDIPLWYSNPSWVRQVNRSSSCGGVVRGCHAQTGIFCQGKMVEAVNKHIYDIITDARPDSNTFGTSCIFLLSPERHNKLWVPRGFLHSFVVPSETKDNAIFEYFCDNTYRKESEIVINPKTLIPSVVEKFREIFGDSEEYNPLYKTFENEITYSEKDKNGLDYVEFMKKTRKEFKETGKVWYR